MPRRGEWGTRAQEKRRHAYLLRHPWCVACGAGIGADLQIDHIVPRVLGGSLNDESNWQTLCGPCNATKGTSSMTSEQIREIRARHRRGTRPAPSGPGGVITFDYTRKRSDP